MALFGLAAGGFIVAAGLSESLLVILGAAFVAVRMAVALAYQRFETPRGGKIALRYLVGALFWLLLASLISQFLPRLALIWFSLTLSQVAAAYAEGAVDVLSKKNGRHRGTRRVFYAPFLLGCWINWWFWRPRLELMNEIVPGLWIGRRPGNGEWGPLETAGIRRVIDLVPELPVRVPKHLEYYHKPLLDLTIPDPYDLNWISGCVGRIDPKSPVLIFCALGLSRSAMAASAVLLRFGRSHTEIDIAVQNARPRRVTNEYMRVAADLLAEERVLGQVG